MQEIKYLLPTNKVFAGCKRVLQKNGFRIVFSSEAEKQIEAIKKQGFWGPELKVNVVVNDQDGCTTLVLKSSHKRGTFPFLNFKKRFPAEKLIDELNTHIR
jgi:hypothetical protein